MANNTDIDFASKLRDVMTFLFENVDSPNRKQAYDMGIKLLNARFGACPRCGHINTGGKFCSECGQQLDGEVPVQNDNIESVDFLIAKKLGNSMTILSIEDNEASAVLSLRKQYNRGINAGLYKRTIERIDNF